MRKPLLLLGDLLLMLGCLTWIFQARWPIVDVQAASLPKVVLSAESLAPRPIEQRTGEAVTHDYAQAWQDLADGLDTNRTDLLGDYFTGEAKVRFTQRTNEQRNTDLRTRYHANGNPAKAVFPSYN